MKHIAVLLTFVFVLYLPQIRAERVVSIVDPPTDPTEQYFPYIGRPVVVGPIHYPTKDMYFPIIDYKFEQKTSSVHK